MKYFKFFRGYTYPTDSIESPVGGRRALRATWTPEMAHDMALRVTWTPEMAHDMAAYHDINAEEELTRLLSQEINEEIIRNLNNLGGNRA
jgi:hypothetical protein